VRQYSSPILIVSEKTIGAYNVVQILSSDTSTNRTAGKIIETTYLHIFWSGCIAHTQSLTERGCQVN